MTPQERKVFELALEALEQWNTPLYKRATVITSINEVLAQPEQEPVAMRMPKVGDRVVCIEDESLATVQSLTAGGSPDIKFDDGSHGTYLLREFAELFRYASTPQRTWVGLTDEEIDYYIVHRFDVSTKKNLVDLIRLCEAKLRNNNYE